MSLIVGGGILQVNPETVAQHEPSRLLRSKLLSSVFNGEWLTTHAPNTLSLTSFFSGNLFQIARDNIAAIVLALTAARHTADLAVTAGHKHDAILTRIMWKQLATFHFHDAGDNAAAGSGLSPVGTPPNECIDAIVLSSAAAQALAYCRFWAQPVDSARIIPRIRVSNDNSATTDCTITLSFYDRDMNFVSFRAITFSTDTLRNRVWIEMDAINLSGLGIADPDQATRQHFIVKVTGQLAADTEDVALHELQLGVQQA